MTGIVNLPIPDSATASEMLEGASRRDFVDVMILGHYADGEMRHASTMTKERELWFLSLRKAQLLGIVHGATIPPKGAAQ